MLLKTCSNGGFPNPIQKFTEMTNIHFSNTLKVSLKNTVDNPRCFSLLLQELLSCRANSEVALCLEVLTKLLPFQSFGQTKFLRP